MTLTGLENKPLHVNMEHDIEAEEEEIAIKIFMIMMYD